MNLIEAGNPPLPQDTRLIPLTQGQFAIVDAADFDWLSQWKWYAVWSKAMKSFYVYRMVRDGGKPRIIQMHRLILGLEHGDKHQGDHVNHDTLDNRRANLRIATAKENRYNSRKAKNNTSGYKGVSFDPQKGRWRARIQIENGKLKHLGRFKNPEDAYRAYCSAAVEYRGEFACFG